MRMAGIVGIGLALSAMVGVGTAKWTMADTSGFYTSPHDGRVPLYARERPVEAVSWDEPVDTVTPAYSDYASEAYATAAGSTATSVEPAYRSASGS